MKKVLAAIIVAVALGGCSLGKPGPVEQYLRVTGGEEQPCDQSGVPAESRVVVAVRQVKAAEALDRQAVMLARGRVSSPSLRWYWEAAPGRLVEQAVVKGLACSPPLAAAWPARYTTEATYSLTGTVTAFEVQESSMALHVAFDCQIWDGEGTRLIDSRTFTAQAPVGQENAEAIAAAGTKALAVIGGDVGGWVRSLASAQGPRKAGK